jgi:RNA polymerase sigma-70 factor (ECF subfamily)
MDNIMIRVAEGDRKAFDKLFFMYYPKVRNYLSHFIPSKEQTEDLAQDFFIKLWNNRTNLSAIKNPDSYFFVSSKNMALNYLKKVKRLTQKLSVKLSLRWNK